MVIVAMVVVVTVIVGIGLVVMVIVVMVLFSMVMVAMVIYYMVSSCRFRELLFEFSACEDNSEMLVEALEPLLERPPSGQLKSEGGGVAVAQLHSWVQGVLR